MSLQSLQKIIKCAGNEDVVTLRADESHDVLGLLFEDKSEFVRVCVESPTKLFLTLHSDPFLRFCLSCHQRPLEWESTR